MSSGSSSQRPNRPANPNELGATTISNPPPAGGMDKTYVNPQAPSADDLGATVVPPKASPNTTQTSNLAATQVGRGEQPAAAASKPTASGGGISQLGKFKLKKKLGQGGMGVVYLGEHVELGRPVAIKTLTKELASKGDFVERFMREARTMARLEHPNAVKVFDVGQDHGIHFVAMEFIDGKSMQHWMDTLGKIPVGDAVHVVLRCAEAMKEAHAMNLVHRDIKPDNIMLTARGAVKVADFGLAKATDEDMSMTQSGTGLGTPYYMAPEQARNAKRVDGRADLYALGVTLYYFVTGKLPFSGSSALEVVMAKEKGTYADARKLNPEVPERLDLVIGKLMAKSPDHRFKDCDELIRQLAGLGLEHPSLSFIDAPNKVVATSSASSGAKTAIGAAGLGKTVTGPGASGVSSKTPGATAGNPAAQWEVETKNPQGQVIRPKWTTANILSQIHTGTIDQTAKARPAGSTGAYLPLAQYAEFEKAIHARIQKAKAQASGGRDMKAEYAKIERQQRWRKFNKWIWGMFSGAAGFLGLLIYLAIVLGLVIGGIVAYPYIRDLVQQQVNKSGTTTEAPAAPPAAN